MATSVNNTLTSFDLDLLLSSAPSLNANSVNTYFDNILDSLDKTNVQNVEENKTADYGMHNSESIQNTESEYQVQNVKVYHGMVNKPDYDMVMENLEKKNKDYELIKKHFVKLGLDFANLHEENRASTIAAMNAHNNCEKLELDIKGYQENIKALQFEMEAIVTMNKAQYCTIVQYKTLVEDLQGEVATLKNEVKSEKILHRSEKRVVNNLKSRNKLYEEHLCLFAGVIEKKYPVDPEIQRLIKRYSKKKADTENFDARSTDTGWGSSLTSYYSPANSINLSPLSSATSVSHHDHNTTEDLLSPPLTNIPSELSIGSLVFGESKKETINNKSKPQNKTIEAKPVKSKAPCELPHKLRSPKPKILDITSTSEVVLIKSSNSKSMESILNVNPPSPVSPVQHTNLTYSSPKIPFQDNNTTSKSVVPVESISKSTVLKTTDLNKPLETVCVQNSPKPVKPLETVATKGLTENTTDIIKSSNPVVATCQVSPVDVNKKLQSDISSRLSEPIAAVIPIPVSTIDTVKPTITSDMSNTKLNIADKTAETLQPIHIVTHQTMPFKDKIEKIPALKQTTDITKTVQTETMISPEVKTVEVATSESSAVVKSVTLTKTKNNLIECAANTEDLQSIANLLNQCIVDNEPQITVDVIGSSSNGKSPIPPKPAVSTLKLPTDVIMPVDSTPLSSVETTPSKTQSFAKGSQVTSHESATDMTNSPKSISLVTNSGIKSSEKTKALKSISSVKCLSFTDMTKPLESVAEVEPSITHKIVKPFKHAIVTSPAKTSSINMIKHMSPHVSDITEKNIVKVETAYDKKGETKVPDPPAFNESSNYSRKTQTQHITKISESATHPKIKYESLNKVRHQNVTVNQVAHQTNIDKNEEEINDLKVRLILDECRLDLHLISPLPPSPTPDDDYPENEEKSQPENCQPTNVIKHKNGDGASNNHSPQRDSNHSEDKGKRNEVCTKNKTGNDTSGPHTNTAYSDDSQSLASHQIDTKNNKTDIKITRNSELEIQTLSQIKRNSIYKSDKQCPAIEGGVIRSIQKRKQEQLANITNATPLSIAECRLPNIKDQSQKLELKETQTTIQPNIEKCSELPFKPDILPLSIEEIICTKRIRSSPRNTEQKIKRRKRTISDLESSHNEDSAENANDLIKSQNQTLSDPKINTEYDGNFTYTTSKPAHKRISRVNDINRTNKSPTKHPEYELTIDSNQDINNKNNDLNVMESQNKDTNQDNLKLPVLKNKTPLQNKTDESQKNKSFDTTNDGASITTVECIENNIPRKSVIETEPSNKFLSRNTKTDIKITRNSEFEKQTLWQIKRNSKNKSDKQCPAIKGEVIRPIQKRKQEQLLGNIPNATSLYIAECEPPNINDQSQKLELNEKQTIIQPNTEQCSELQLKPDVLQLSTEENICTNRIRSSPRNIEQKINRRKRTISDIESSHTEDSAENDALINSHNQTLTDPKKINTEYKGNFTYTTSKPAHKRISRVNDINRTNKLPTKHDEYELTIDSNQDINNKNNDLNVLESQNKNTNQDKLKLSALKNRPPLQNNIDGGHSNKPFDTNNQGAPNITVCKVENNSRESVIETEPQNKRLRVCANYKDINMFQSDIMQIAHKANKNNTPELWKHNLLDRMLYLYGSNPKKQNEQHLKSRTMNDQAIAIEIEKVVTKCVNTIENRDNYIKSLNDAANLLLKHESGEIISGMTFYLRKPERKTQFLPKRKEKDYTNKKIPPTKHIMALIEVIETINKRNMKFWDAVLNVCEFMLFTLDKRIAPSMELLETISQLFINMCIVKNDYSRLWIFILDGMYACGYKAILIVKYCLDLAPNMLPNAGEKDILSPGLKPLIKCIVFLIHFHSCDDYFKKVQELRNTLKYKYGYEIAEENETTILFMLKEAIIDLRDIYFDKSLLQLTLLILAKRKGTQWCHKNVVQKILLPIIKGQISVSKVAFQFSLAIIGELLKPYKYEMTVHCEEVVNILLEMFEKSCNQDVKESILNGLINMNMDSVSDRINNCLMNWNPPTISPSFEEALKVYIQRKNMKRWKAFYDTLAT